MTFHIIMTYFTPSPPPPRSFKRSILLDIKLDNRITSLNARAGIRNALITILDQLQRCQKSLNEFLEVNISNLIVSWHRWSQNRVTEKQERMCLCIPRIVEVGKNRSNLKGQKTKAKDPNSPVRIEQGWWMSGAGGHAEKQAARNGLWFY